MYKNSNLIKVNNKSINIDLIQKQFNVSTRFFPLNLLFVYAAKTWVLFAVVEFYGSFN